MPISLLMRMIVNYQVSMTGKSKAPSKLEEEKAKEAVMEFSKTPEAIAMQEKLRKRKAQRGN